MHHISHKVDGVEFSTGSLGHGLPYAVGKSLAAKILKKNWKSVVLLGDGELNEGSNWEAILFAPHHNLDNLTCIVDYNKLQSLTTVKETLNLEPLKDKITSFGWDVIDIDGSATNSQLDAIYLNENGTAFTYTLSETNGVIKLEELNFKNAIQVLNLYFFAFKIIKDFSLNK